MKGSKLTLRVRHDIKNGIDRPKLVSSYRNESGVSRQQHWASVYLWPKKYVDALKSLILERHSLVIESNRSDITGYDRQKALKKAGELWLRIEKLKRDARIDVSGERALKDRRRLDPITRRRRVVQESHDATPVVTVFDRLGKARVALERALVGANKWDANTRQTVREQFAKFKQWLDEAEKKVK